MESVGNKDKLLARIIADAHTDADVTLQQSDDAVKSIEAESCERIAALVSEHEKKRDALVKGVIDGYRTRATLQARKEALKSRREALDKAFELTHVALSKLDENKRKKLYLSILNNDAVDGDTIQPSKADRAILSEILRTGLTLSDVDAPIDGGFRIIGKGYEKDCSIDAIMAQLRMDEETQAAKKLFE